jgi:multidrug efflux pump subunit AcrA (membrane-fusion protein)
MKKSVVGILFIMLLGVTPLLAACSLPGSPGAAAATPTVVLPPVKSVDQVVAEAKVVPIQNAQLSLPTGGVVAEVLIKEGDEVQAGQTLLRLDAARQAAAVAQAEAQLLRAQNAVAELEAGARPEEIAAAEAAVAAAQAQLARVQQGPRAEEIQAAQAALEGAQAALRRVQEGPREGELVAARADVANAQASLAQAQAAYDRVKWDPNIQARPESLQLEQATNAYNAAKARLAALQEGATPAQVDAARAQVDQARAQLEALQSPARAADVAAAEAEIQRAQAQLELLRSGVRPETIAGAKAEVAAAEAALEQARVALAETELKAPFAGTVAALDTKVGEQVGPGSPIVTLADLSAWQIETDDLTELSIVKVKEGDPVLITFDAIPDLELPGTVLRIKPIGENKLGDITYTVIVGLDESDPRLRWNMTAAVEIEPE